MTKGWFVGDFEPSIIRTNSCEVGIKAYKKGTKELSHYHKASKELLYKGSKSLGNGLQ